MSLPKIPGYSFDRNLGKTSRPRVQILDHIRDTCYPYYDDKIRQPNRFQGSRIPGEFNGPTGPKWKVFDKKVLCFDGYWLESVPESPNEKYRTRACKVFFYLEDDTIQVLEPRIRNSSLVQGTVVNRRRVMKQPPNDTIYYTVDDLNIGEVLNLGARSIQLTACDPFTLNVLRRFGKAVPHYKVPPENPIDVLKQKLLGRDRKGKGMYRPTDNLLRFLDHGKHILRFYCYWNDNEISNDPRSMTLHYFLEDDTIEIMENLPRNCGREGRLFLKRQRLPQRKISEGLTFPGHLSDPGYLNVIRTAKFEHKIIDSLETENPAVPCYKDCDLSVGQYINVFGRKFLICDCDEFTKEYYKIKYGVDQTKSIDMSHYWDHGVHVTRDVPPHNGWGSEEDSIINCRTIRPSEVVRSHRKFMTSVRTIDDLLNLNYLARIKQPDSHFDQSRLFVISYRTEDDNIFIKESTSERPGHNFVGFISRGNIRKPTSEWRDANVPEYYKAKDFYLGAIIFVKGYHLEIFLTDDYSLRFMEKHSNMFMTSSITVILEKMRKALKNERKNVDYFSRNQDSHNSGFISYQQLEQFKINFLDNIINFQELVTLARHYTDRTTSKASKANKMIAHIRHVLRKHSFMDYYKIKDHWYDISPNSTAIPLITARAVLKSMRLPLTDEMLYDLLLLSRPPNSEDMVDVCLLLDIVEWQKFQPDYFNRVGQFLECEEFVHQTQKLSDAANNEEDTFNIGQIKWQQLMNDVYNPPQKSTMHPDNQRLLQTMHCKEALF